MVWIPIWQRYIISHTAQKDAQNKYGKYLKTISAGDDKYPLSVFMQNLVECYEISEKLKETAEAQASKKKAEEQIKRITEKDMKLKDYDKFLLYGDVSLRKKDISKNGGALPEYLLSGAIVQKQKSYKKKRWISLLTGVVATFFFSRL